MECPVCEHELIHWDIYGRNLHLDSLDRIKPGFIKSGDIYKCPNEECESERIWHTRGNSDELYEGMPC